MFVKEIIAISRIRKFTISQINIRIAEMNFKLIIIKELSRV